MDVDLTVRLGDILTMVGLLAGGLYVVNMQRADIRLLAQRVVGVESSISAMSEKHDASIASISSKLNGITDILIAQARHDERITAIETNAKAAEDEMQRFREELERVARERRRS